LAIGRHRQVDPDADREKEETESYGDDACEYALEVDHVPVPITNALLFSGVFLAG